MTTIHNRSMFFMDEKPVGQVSIIAAVILAIVGWLKLVFGWLGKRQDGKNEETRAESVERIAIATTARDMAQNNLEENQRQAREIGALTAKHGEEHRRSLRLEADIFLLRAEFHRVSNYAHALQTQNTMLRMMLADIWEKEGLTSSQIEAKLPPIPNMDATDSHSRALIDQANALRAESAMI